jgi:hypothetical protein
MIFQSFSVHIYIHISGFICKVPSNELTELHVILCASRLALISIGPCESMTSEYKFTQHSEEWFHFFTIYSEILEGNKIHFQNLSCTETGFNCSMKTKLKTVTLIHQCTTGLVSKCRVLMGAVIALCHLEGP